MAPDSSPDAAHLVPFSVGDWLVEPRACRASRHGTVVKLRPQLVGLLVCLARRPGEIVLKEEILAEVWPGQFIAESGLSRCVAELRQGLGDNAQEPRLIETFPKRGYRLIAPVVWMEPGATLGGQPVQAAPAEDTRHQPAVSEPDAAVGSRSGGAWRAGIWMTVAAGLLTAVVAGVMIVMRSPASALTGRDSVLLADVRNTTGDRAFDDALKLALAVNLGQAPFLRMLPEDAVRAAVVRTGRSPDERVTGALALDVCRREGAAVVLAGTIAPLGSRYAIGLEAVACGTGEGIGRALEEARDKEQVLEALDRAATRIRRALGESRASLQQYNVSLVRATTPSLDALKALTLGDYHRDHARPAEAFAMYRQATEIDPAFALAWARRGAAAYNLQLDAEVIPAFRRAYELRDRVTVPERFYITAGYHRIVEADPEKAIEVYRSWKQLYPGSLVPPVNLASTLVNWMGQYEAALPEAREAVRLAPYSAVASSGLVLACLGSGRTAEARTAIAEAVARGQDDRLVHQHLANLAVLDGDQAALEREIRWASGTPSAALRILRLRASAAAARGRLRESRQLWSEAADKAAETGPAQRVATVRLHEAETEALLGDVRAAKLAVEAGLALDKGTATLLSSSIALDLAGDAARAKTILDAVARQQPSDPVLRRVWLPVALALNAAGRRDADEARGTLQPIVRFERGHAFTLVPLGVRAIINRVARRPAEAAAAFEDLISLHALHPASPWVPFARVSLARVLRESGDATRSLAAYDAFLESWKDADADAPLLVAARRERAAAAVR